MAEITGSQIQACFDAGIRVERGLQKREEAVFELVASVQINRASASDYVTTVGYMREGRAFKRTIKADGAEIYLRGLYSVYGLSGLLKGLTSVQGHIEYYEKLRNVNLPKLRSAAATVEADLLKAEFETQPSEPSFQDKVEDAIATGVVDRRARLAKAHKQPQQVLVRAVAFVRNPDVVAEALYLAKGQCQKCKRSAPFRKPDGVPYLEVHHIHHLADGGEDTLDNAIAICPNCHREAHFGANKEGMFQ